MKNLMFFFSAATSITQQYLKVTFTRTLRVLSLYSFVIRNQ